MLARYIRAGEMFVDNAAGALQQAQFLTDLLILDTKLGLRDHVLVLGGTAMDIREWLRSLSHRRKLLAAIAALADHPVPATSVAAKSSVAPSAVVTSPERRQLTVMFCDLVGSTALSARLDPEDMRGIIAAVIATSLRPLAGRADVASQLAVAVVKIRPRLETPVPAPPRTPSRA